MQKSPCQNDMQHSAAGEDTNIIIENETSSIGWLWEKMGSLFYPSFVAKAADLNAKLEEAVEFIPNRLYFIELDPAVYRPSDTALQHFFCVDDRFRYISFVIDFGPLNIGRVHEYCILLRSKLMDPELRGKRIYHVCAPGDVTMVNAAFLIGAFAVLEMGDTPMQAHARLGHYKDKLRPFRDAGLGPANFPMTMLDTFKGLYRAWQLGLYNPSTFDLPTYQYYEQVRNGDLNWIIPNKLLAFSGPHETREMANGYSIMVCEDYYQYYAEANVTDVVRLNEPEYSVTKFTSQGINHHDLYYPDGSTPPAEIVDMFLTICDNAKGAVAVHCRAGLGRTGTLNALYLMKTYRMTAMEAIVWCRLCRPGSIMGPQQQFLVGLQEVMWLLNSGLPSRSVPLPVPSSSSSANHQPGSLAGSVGSTLGPNHNVGSLAGTNHGRIVVPTATSLQRCSSIASSKPNHIAHTSSISLQRSASDSGSSSSSSSSATAVCAGRPVPMPIGGGTGHSGSSSASSATAMPHQAQPRIRAPTPSAYRPPQQSRDNEIALVLAQQAEYLEKRLRAINQESGTPLSTPDVTTAAPTTPVQPSSAPYTNKPIASKPEEPKKEKTADIDGTHPLVESRPTKDEQQAMPPTMAPVKRRTSSRLSFSSLFSKIQNLSLDASAQPALKTVDEPSEAASGASSHGGSGSFPMPPPPPQRDTGRRLSKTGMPSLDAFNSGSRVTSTVEPQP